MANIILPEDESPVNLIHLPENPGAIQTQALIESCRAVYERRADLIAFAENGMPDEAAVELLDRAKAVEAYLSNREGRDDARRAARIVEVAVGAWLGPAERTQDEETGRYIHVARERYGYIPKDDRHRFRLMRRTWELWDRPLLDPEKDGPSRKKVLVFIEELLRPKAPGEGVAVIQKAEAASWLRSFEAGSMDLLLTDPPYSTDVENIGAFVQGWLPLALSRISDSGRAFAFIGAYADELAAYFSTSLPDGWSWSTPHAWVYRNTIGPTPEHDFVRNWQCVLSARGPDAPRLHSDRITELLAGFTENAPDGRREVKHHRWQKPMDAVKRIIEVCTEVGDTVFDPFAGSGTTLLAAKEIGRSGIGCDNDELSVLTAIARGCDAA